MKRLILAAGALLLATANTPPATSAGAMPGGEIDSVVAAEAPARGPDKAEKPAKPVKAKPERVAAAQEPAASYPRCSATVRDRCVQGRSAAPQRSASHDRRIQLAMRAGERG